MMQLVPSLLNQPHGLNRGGNGPAIAMLDRVEFTPSEEPFRWEDVHGQKSSAEDCATGLNPGEQRCLGMVKVKGLAHWLVCSSVNGQPVITLIPVIQTSGTLVLSTREKQVLELISRGFTSQAISRRLAISGPTVRTHVEHIRDKLGVKTRAQAVARALALGEIE